MQRPRCMINRGADDLTRAVIEWVALNKIQVFRYRANVRRDGHLIVIEHDNDVSVRRASVVESLVRETRCQRTIAQDSDDFEGLFLQIPADRHAKRGRNRGRGMTGAERIVFALRPLQEAGDPVLLPQRLHLAITTREELMRVALVADIPHELIAWRVEHVVERGRQLDDAESGADVAASPGADVDQ